MKKKIKKSANKLKHNQNKINQYTQQQIASKPNNKQLHQSKKGGLGSILNLNRGSLKNKISESPSTADLGNMLPPSIRILTCFLMNPTI